MRNKAKILLTEEEEKPDIPSVYDESEDFDSELEEDLIFEEEWF